MSELASIPRYFLLIATNLAPLGSLYLPDRVIVVSSHATVLSNMSWGLPAIAGKSLAELGVEVVYSDRITGHKDGEVRDAMMSPLLMLHTL